MKTLEWGKKVLEEINFDIGRGPRSKLEKFGFKQLKGNFSKGVWYNKKKNIIIKIGLLSISRKPKYVNIIPTIIINKYDNLYLIQKKADRRFKNKALKILEDEFSKIDISNSSGLSNVYDIHMENVGWYNNKPVVFDW